ncbi:potassium two pore domain channel subfamily K member galene isoform X2 [Leptinotarsa decemlineata]|uniref:potassium two pore domain channel subfamily K member galene isoform X2 n=1 Tax=Leptinotarsa decemlineata TaxID=7539 RepID=UPI003D303E6C
MSSYRSSEVLGYENPSACSRFLHYSYKTVTCLFSHITLVSMVVSYCVLGAFTFEALEVDNEKLIKRGIHRIRENVSEYIWNFTQNMNALEQDNFTKGVQKYLKSFENSLLDAMNKDGWDGIEDENKVQWTLTGSLFYSIIVITTIGYGHIAPKTTWGKVVTIFYAILGIPLMLLCLSNIGDIMATSFRFLYWRVCCYVCTKKPKKMKRAKSVRNGSRTDGSRFSRSRNASFRRSMRTSTRSADSGFGLSDVRPSSHSDTDLRYNGGSGCRSSSVPRPRSSKWNRDSENSNNRKISHISTTSSQFQGNHVQHRGHSLDRKRHLRDIEIELDPILLDNSSILCNKYVVGKNDGFARTIPGLTPRQNEPRAVSMPPGKKSRSLSRNQNYLEPPSRFLSPESSEEEDMESVRGRSRRRSPRRRSRSPNPLQNSPSPRMMTPLGYAHKSKYLDDPDSDMEYDYYDDNYDVGRARTRPVPIWLCVLLVVGYILAGAYLFKSWENWEYLDAAYFCFITLTTIGFGDLVPAKGVSQDGYYATISIALCSLYLLFGISLLAMSFNLVQEEVISNVKSVAKTLGIIKSNSEDEYEDD